MIKPDDITIIIPFHKNKNMLSLSIRTLLSTLQNKRPSIIIIANNSDMKEIEIEDPFILQNCRIQYHYEELFWPGAINAGVEAADTKYILFCDPDIFYFSEWLSPLCKCYEEHDKAGIVSPKIINPLTNRIMDFGMGYNTLNVFHTCKGLKYNHPITMHDRKVQAACGAVFLTEKNLFLEVGGIDESMPYIYCDNDYCLSLSMIGYETWVCADSMVYHKGNTDQKNSKYYAFSFLREDSKAAFYAKNYQKREIDIDKWLIFFWNWYQKNSNTPQNNYVMLNFSTLLDDKLYKDIFVQKLGITILNEYRYHLGERNCSKIQLYNHIRPDMYDIVVPFLYFVDEFEGLIDNGLWFELRDISRDLVIDKHGNILSMSDISMHAV